MRIRGLVVCCLLNSWPLTVDGAEEPSVAQHAAPTAGQIEFFEKQVRPVLAENCWKCHGPDEQEAGLRLDSRAGVLAGGDTGPALVPGRPEASELILAVSYDPDGYQMPPTGKLPQQAIDALTAWVRMGAPWPADRRPGVAAAAAEGFDLEERARHWSFHSVVRPPVPTVADGRWPRTPIDAYIRSRLENAGLSPAPAADRRTWLRRVSFDLAGLPPTLDEINEFLADDSPDAPHRVVDRLMGSPHYGERWGRHWLDLVRFAESAGHEFDYEIPYAWRYRDYVVRALNADLPYDEFVMEHVAGDLLDTPRRHVTHGWNESILATGFWWFSQGKHSPVDIRAEECDRFDNQIDVLGKAFLGLTIACARCHDHKFDPISTRDYYAVAGYLQSTRRQLAFLDDERMASAYGQLTELKRDVNEALAGLPFRTDAAAAIGPGEQAGSLPRVADAACVGSGGDDNDVAASQSISIFESFEDYEGWFSSGPAFRSRPTSAGDFVIGESAENPIAEVLPAGLAHSGLLSKQFRGVLRSPTFTIDKSFIDYRVRRVGGRPEPGIKHKNGQIHLIVDGFHLIQNPLYGHCTINTPGDGQWHWHRQDVSRFQGSRAYLEIEDEEPDGYIVADQIVFTDGPRPAETGDRTPPNIASRLTPRQRQRLAGLWRDYRDAEARFEPSRRAIAAADGSGENEHVLIRGNHNKPGEKVPRRFLEVFGQDFFETTAASTDSRSPSRLGSGRLELARQMAAVENPLTARVVVNRLWQHHFGRGIVPTVDNFGVLGEPPSHPELLDWLACDLMAWDRVSSNNAPPLSKGGQGGLRGESTDPRLTFEATVHPSPPSPPLRRGGSPHSWSLKRLQRHMLLSATYGMDSRIGDLDAEARDPENRLWHRMPVRRLEAETIRDAILAVSGRLDRRMEGESVPPHLTPFMEGRGRPPHSGPLDGNGRRSIYINVRRNFLTPLFLAFDYPTPLSTMGTRSASNVPAQALALMNNEFVVQQAGVWARRVLSETEAAVRPSANRQAAEDQFATRRARQRAAVKQLYREAFTRPPTAAELAAALQFLSTQGMNYDGPDDRRTWADLCHVLLNVKEFVFVQ